MGKEREEYGETLQERRSPTPDRSYHRKAGRSKKGPYVVTASSFLFYGEDWPSYFMVQHVDSIMSMSKRTYWKQFVVHGEGLELTYKEASKLRRALENEYKEEHPRRKR